MYCVLHYKQSPWLGSCCSSVGSLDWPTSSVFSSLLIRFSSFCLSSRNSKVTDNWNMLIVEHINYKQIIDWWGWSRWCWTAITYQQKINHWLKRIKPTIRNHYNTSITNKSLTDEHEADDSEADNRWADDAGAVCCWFAATVSRNCCSNDNSQSVITCERSIRNITRYKS